MPIIFHVPHIKSHFRCNKISALVQGCFVTIRFNGEESLAPRLNLKLGKTLFSAVRDCLFNIFTGFFHIGASSSVRNLSTRHAVETRTHLSGSNCNKCKIYKLHGLTFVGLGETELVNQVKIVVNCYWVVSASQECCKIEVSECNCVDITLQFKYWNYIW